MTRLLLLLISCATLFAQRTPFKVNGTVVNNPDLTNSATITWTIVGAKISGAAAGGGGGDTIWTNDNGTITLVDYPAVTISTDDGKYSGTRGLFDWHVDSTNGGNMLAATMHNDANTGFYPFLFYGNIYGTNQDFASGVVINNLSTPQATSASIDGGNMNASIWGLAGWQVNASYGVQGIGIGVEGEGIGDYLHNYGVLGMTDSHAASTNQNTAAIIGYNFQISNQDITAHSAAIVGVRYLNDGILSLNQDAVAYLDNGDAGGDIIAGFNNHIRTFQVASNGLANASAGFGSTATDAAVTIASTGWTNTLGKNAQVMMDGVALVYKVADAAGTFWYTNGTALSGAEFTLQTGGKFIITSGTLNVGRAKVW